MSFHFEKTDEHKEVQNTTEKKILIQQYLDFRRFALSSVFNYNHVSKFRRLLRSFVAFRHHRAPSCIFHRSVFEYKSFGVRCFFEIVRIESLIFVIKKTKLFILYYFCDYIVNSS
jgi:hypothetical protein